MTDPANRLIAAIWPTRYERAMSWLRFRAWSINDQRGPFNWIGDRADDAWAHSINTRARRGTHTKAKRP